MKKLVVIILIVGFAIGVYFYMRQGKQVVQPTAEMATPTANEVLGARRIELTGSDTTFDKKEIRVKKDEKVTILFKNVGGTHNFVIDNLKIETPLIEKGQETLVNLPTDKPGTYEYYCSFDGHRLLGMSGTLIIEE